MQGSEVDANHTAHRPQWRRCNLSNVASQTTQRRIEIACRSQPPTACCAAHCGGNDGSLDGSIARRASHQQWTQYPTGELSCELQRTPLGTRAKQQGGLQNIQRAQTQCLQILLCLTLDPQVEVV